jgi:uncharacterized protein
MSEGDVPAGVPQNEIPSKPESRLLLDTPVGFEDRINSVDVLRGFALLGILVINIGMMGLPQIAINNPAPVGNDTGANLAIWTISRIFFFQKFMAIFSMLFGAGMILMYQRAEAAGRILGKTYYRRLGWLLLIGMIHAYFIWWGDILYHYAVSGMIIYLLRRLSARRMIIIGVIAFFIGSLFFFGLGFFMDICRSTALEGQAAQTAGEELTPSQESMMEIWESIEPQLDPPPELIDEEVARFRGGYWSMVLGTIPQILSMHTFVFVFYIAWRAIGLMLIGMGLLKLGIFSAAAPRKLYLTFLMAGYGLGLPISAFIVYKIINSGFDMLYNFGFYAIYDSIAILLITAGHIGLVMLICQSDALSSIKSRLAAVGRMALTNYLMHSILLVPIFYGYGLKQFGQIGYFGLSALVIAMWALQMHLSPVWLRHFRYGPIEWLWRSLTYKKKQLMRI